MTGAGAGAVAVTVVGAVTVTAGVGAAPQAARRTAAGAIRRLFMAVTLTRGACYTGQAENVSNSLCIPALGGSKQTQQQWQDALQNMQFLSAGLGSMSTQRTSLTTI